MLCNCRPSLNNFLDNFIVGSCPVSWSRDNSKFKNHFSVIWQKQLLSWVSKSLKLSSLDTCCTLIPLSWITTVGVNFWGLSRPWVQGELKTQKSNRNPEKEPRIESFWKGGGPQWSYWPKKVKQYKLSSTLKSLNNWLNHHYTTFTDHKNLTYCRNFTEFRKINALLLRK